MLAIASGGGHWIELVRISPSFEEYDTLYASTARNLIAPSGPREVRTIRDASASEPVRLIFVLLDVVRLITDFRPKLIVTTGAAPGLLAIMVAKLLGCRTLWIDSIANADKLSQSGRLAARFADVRLTQWPHLADQDQGVRYVGAIL